MHNENILPPGTVVFAGAGPGAVDLVTVRCREAIAAADVIIYAGSLVNPELLTWARPSCARHDSASLDLEEIIALMREAAARRARILRLQTGDVSMYGAITEQMNELDKLGIPYKIIPGVSSVFAAAAAVKAELTLPGVSQTVILGRRAGRTPVPARESLTSLAAHRATMALFLSVADMAGLVAELRAGGYPAATPVAVVYRATWEEEKIVRGTLDDIVPRVREAGIGRQAMILVGEVLRRKGELSRLYAPGFSHGYRRGAGKEPAPAVPPADPGASRFAGRVAVYALTPAAAGPARTLMERLPAAGFFSRRAAPPAGGEVFAPGTFRQLVRDNWNRFAGHVFVMAAGIVMRTIADLLRDKTVDPAVVVVDEKGKFCLSLLSGHIGGANRLAREAAALLGGQAVITTATDVQGLLAFDELAARQGWRVVNPEKIKLLNSLLLARKPIGVVCEAAVFQRFFAADRSLVHVPPPAVPAASLAGLVVIDDKAGELPPVAVPVLHLRRPRLVLGIGCRRGVDRETLAAAIGQVCRRHGFSREQVVGMASVDLKSDEAGLRALAAKNGWPLTFFPAAALAAVAVPSPSDRVAAAVGSPSVSEAAAMLAAGGRLLVAKEKIGPVTVAVAAVPEAASLAAGDKGAAAGTAGTGVTAGGRDGGQP